MGENMNEIAKRVIDVIEDTFGSIDYITPDTEFICDIHVDELDMIALVMTLEDVFDIDIDDKKVFDFTPDECLIGPKLNTVGELISVVEETITKGGRNETEGLVKERG